MTRRSHLTLIVNNSVSSEQDGRTVGPKSCSKFLDPYWLRVNLQDIWGAYNDVRFARVEDVAAFYGVSFQTALNWKNRLGRPTADKLLMAYLSDPAGFAACFGPDAVLRDAA